MTGKIENSIVKKLVALNPNYLKVTNESPQHHVPEGAETHFKVVIVAGLFSKLRLVQRHQEVYKLLKQEMEEGLHALALHTFSPEEWEKKQHESEPETPACRGGMVHESIINVIEEKR